MMTTGPRCDYQDCSRHSEQVDNRIPNRNRYCTIECRNDEIKRRLRVNDAKRKAAV